MKENFEASLAALLGSEGGWSDDPHDNGGKTNFGVTQGTYDAFRLARGLGKQSVKLITKDEVRDIYRQYWNAVNANGLPNGCDYATFDFAVNSGPDRAARYLQAVVGVKVDGKIGPKTIEAIKSPMATISALCDERLKYLRTLDDWEHFGRGWTNRVYQVLAKAKGMAK